MKTHIHTHIWVDSINETCPFCGREIHIGEADARTCQEVIKSNWHKAQEITRRMVE